MLRKQCALRVYRICVQSRLLPLNQSNRSVALPMAHNVHHSLKTVTEMEVIMWELRWLVSVQISREKLAVVSFAYTLGLNHKVKTMGVVLGNLFWFYRRYHVRSLNRDFSVKWSLQTMYEIAL